MTFPICPVHPLLTDDTVNCTFDDILAMDDAAFETYVQQMRSKFAAAWTDHNIPPRRGWTMDEIDEDFAKLAGYPVHELGRADEQVVGRAVIQNTTTLGNAINAWFASEMYKTRINYTEKDDGKSIYDFFVRPELFARYLPYARRHFLRDSFYLFAESVLIGSKLPHFPETQLESAASYVWAFAASERPYGEYELLIEPVLREKSGAYSGYGTKLAERKPLALSPDEFRTLRADGLLPAITCRNVTAKHESNLDAYVFHLRQYRKGQRLFPALFRSFRISMCQYAVNFPPLTAKLLYQNFLGHVDAPHVRVWDPSSGWGGRLLGAMSYNRQLYGGTLQQLTYYGTDPNPAFYRDGTSVYATIADHYNRVRIGNSLFDTPHQYQVFQLGSELFHTTDVFQQHRGTGDLVFTSPPYFNREAYSDDPNQSYKKFSNYDLWRDEFLRPTLRNAYDFLNHDRYLLWNIADIKVGKKYLPLEQDSIDIATSLGFEYDTTVAMALASMPGANRIADDGTATAKNVCKVNGRVMKMEPVLVFRKP